MVKDHLKQSPRKGYRTNTLDQLLDISDVKNIDTYEKYLRNRERNQTVVMSTKQGL